MKRTAVNDRSVVSERRFRKRLALHRAMSIFATTLNTLRRRQAWSLQELSMRTDIPLSRIQQLIAARAAPAWDEVLWCAWALKVPARSLIERLALACDDDLEPGYIEVLQTSRPWETSIDRARKAYLLQKLTQQQGNLLNVSLAEWPVLLPPSLTECLATEAAVLHINALLIEECVDAVLRDGEQLPRNPPGHLMSTMDELLDAALTATMGVTLRVQALMHRHRLHRTAIQVQHMAPSRSEVGEGLHQTMTQLQRPLTILRAFEVADSLDERAIRRRQLAKLFPAVLAMECHAELDAPSSIAQFSARDRQCTANLLRDAGTSMLSISIGLNRLAVLAVPTPSTTQH